MGQSPRPGKLTLPELWLLPLVAFLRIFARVSLKFTDESRESTGLPSPQHRAQWACYGFDLQKIPVRSMKLPRSGCSRVMALLTAYRQSPSPERREQLVRLHGGLVRKVVHRLYRGPQRFSRALEEAGLQGVAAALEAYDPAAGIEFSCFAVSYIRQALLNGSDNAAHTQVSLLPKLPAA